MNTTVRMKASQIYKDWHVIDAAGRSLGRVASEAAILLRGKHKPTYEPHLDDGDFVIIVNASQVKVTGRKAEQNRYYSHSGYPGGLRTRTFEQQFARFPDRVVEDAVKGMLPGGSLGEAIARHLKVYAGPRHPHKSQITGSQKAQSVRSALVADAAMETTKPPRLRPLSIPDVAVAPVRRVVAAPAPKPALASAPKAVEAPVTEAPVAEAAPVAAEPRKPAARAAKAPAKAAAPAAKATAAKAPTKAATPAAKATAAKAPTKAAAPAAKATAAKAPTKAAAPAAKATAAKALTKAAAPAKAAPARAAKATAEAPKPAMKKAADVEPPTAEAPKPRTTRKKAEPATEASAAEEKKPARRRTAAAKTEE
jgi:large subunit ribosomal protein L13